MQKAVYLFIITLLQLLVMGCVGGQGSGEEGGADTLHTLDRARDAYYKQSDFPTARHICRNLLTQKAVQQDPATLYEVYSLLAMVANTEANTPDLLRYATEAERLAHQLNMPAEVGRMQAYAASGLIRMGHVNEGRQRLAQAINELRPLKTFTGLTAYISAVKKQIHDYYNSNQKDQIPPLCMQILDRLDDFLRHQSDYNDLPKQFDAEDFSDFTRGQTYSYLAASLADTGHRTEALHWLHEAEGTKWGQRIDGERMLLTAYESLSMWNKVDTVCQRLSKWHTGMHTTNSIVELQAQAHAAEARGRINEALQLKNRIINLQDTISQHDNTERLAELATVYQLQDAQIEQQAARAAATRRTIYFVCSLILLVLAVGFTIYYRRQHHLLRQKNQTLVEQISKSITYKEKYLAETAKTAPTPLGKQEDLTDSQLFQYLQKIIEEERLYLAPNFGRQTLIDRFHLSKERIGTVFAHGSQYSSLADYTNDRRLEYACLTLVAHPEMSISDVATASGFGSSSVFCRNFKSKYSVTPTEYRQQSEKHY